MINYGIYMICLLVIDSPVFILEKRWLFPSVVASTSDGLGSISSTTLYNISHVMSTEKNSDEKVGLVVDLANRTLDFVLNFNDSAEILHREKNTMPNITVDSVHKSNAVLIPAESELTARKCGPYENQLNCAEKNASRSDLAAVPTEFEQSLTRFGSKCGLFNGKWQCQPVFTDPNVVISTSKRASGPPTANCRLVDGRWHCRDAESVSLPDSNTSNMVDIEKKLGKATFSQGSPFDVDVKLKIREEDRKIRRQKHDIITFPACRFIDERWLCGTSVQNRQGRRDVPNALQPSQQPYRKLSEEALNETRTLTANNMSTLVTKFTTEAFETAAVTSSSVPEDTTTPGTASTDYLNSATTQPPKPKPNIPVYMSSASSSNVTDTSVRLVTPVVIKRLNSTEAPEKWTTKQTKAPVVIFFSMTSPQTAALATAFTKSPSNHFAKNVTVSWTTSFSNSKTTSISPLQSSNTYNPYKYGATGNQSGVGNHQNQNQETVFAANVTERPGGDKTNSNPKVHVLAVKIAKSTPPQNFINKSRSCKLRNSHRENFGNPVQAFPAAFVAKKWNGFAWGSSSSKNATKSVRPGIDSPQIRRLPTNKLSSNRQIQFLPSVTNTKQPKNLTDGYKKFRTAVTKGQLANGKGVSSNTLQCFNSVCRFFTQIFVGDNVRGAAPESGNETVVQNTNGIHLPVTATFLNFNATQKLVDRTTNVSVKGTKKAPKTAALNIRQLYHLRPRHVTLTAPRKMSHVSSATTTNTEDWAYSASGDKLISSGKSPAVANQRTIDSKPKSREIQLTKLTVLEKFSEE